MRCSKAKRLISMYMDGEIDPGLKQSLESHLDNCGSCRGEFEETMKLRDLFAQTGKFKAPYGFATRVMAGAAAGKTAGRAWMPLFAKFAETLVVLAMVAAGTIAGGFLINGMPETSRITSSFSLEIFEPVPPGSVGSAYLAMTEAGHER